jgi:hypothetical protein
MLAMQKANRRRFGSRVVIHITEVSGSRGLKIGGVQYLVMDGRQISLIRDTEKDRYSPLQGKQQYEQKF